MAGMRASLSRARHPAVFLTTWSVSAILGCAVALLAAAWLPEYLSKIQTPPTWAAPLATMAILVIITELRPIMMSRFEGDPISISQAFVFATLYLWGVVPAVTLMAVSVVISELLARKEPWKLFFNVGNYTLSVVAASLVLELGGWPHTDAKDVTAAELALVALSWVAYHLVNLALVAGVAEEQTWWECFTEDFWFYTVSAGAVLALSPLVAVVAIHDSAWVLLPLLIPPLLAVQRTAQMSQEREQLAEEREHRALHDPLTGLPNRTLLADRIEAGLARTPRRGERLVVMLLDLDSFKTVNDGLGHGVGDSLLVDVAERLTQVIRPSDTLARFSGDEFAIVCEAIRDPELEILVKAIRQTIAAPFTIATHEVSLTASIGVAPAAPGSSAQSLIREADSAMFRAKSAGRDQAAHFHQTMHDQATARLDDQLGLRRALERDELRAHYQPVIDLNSGETVGVEALVRWQHPERGLIGPDEFIPLAEDTGLILPLGAWMLETALAQLQRWRRAMPEAGDLWVAVNLSPRQLTDPDLIHKVARALAETGVPPGNLHLELTETAVMNSVDESTATLDALRQLGVHLIIDDFGTGYSSLARLKKLPVTALKVDRSFVDGLGRDSSDLSIVDAIVNLANSLALGVIAEGVETREQLEILQSLGATMGQGYLWAPPLPAADLATWLREVPLHEELAEIPGLLSLRRR
ncbi:MAG: EAL domain-containing protein [Candidatus Nanopelagicales bacterium]|jgi:diguanylate cyclase (GGDEF)-like protein|nr:EAL domain-containing protein [Candidatus Nanopelagicales bacterium]